MSATEFVITCGTDVAQAAVRPAALSVAMLQLTVKDKFGLNCHAHEVALQNSATSAPVDTRKALDEAVRNARNSGFPVMITASEPVKEEEDFESAGFLRQLVQLPLMQRVGEAWGIDPDDIYELIDRFEAGSAPPRPAIRRLCATVADRLGFDESGMAEAVEEAFEGGQELLTSLQEEMVGVEVDYEEEDAVDEDDHALEVQLCFDTDCIACNRAITGELYSCTVCPNKHFCSTCESQNSHGAVHTLRHPLIKIRHPAALASLSPAPIAPPMPSRPARSASFVAPTQVTSTYPVVPSYDSSSSESASDSELSDDEDVAADSQFSFGDDDAKYDRLAQLEKQIAELQSVLATALSR